MGWIYPQHEIWVGYHTSSAASIWGDVMRTCVLSALCSSLFVHGGLDSAHPDAGEPTWRDMRLRRGLWPHCISLFPLPPFIHNQQWWALGRSSRRSEFHGVFVMHVDWLPFELTAKHVKISIQDMRMTEVRFSRIAQDTSGTFNHTYMFSSLIIHSLCQGSVVILVDHRALLRPPHRGTLPRWSVGQYFNFSPSIAVGSLKKGQRRTKVEVRVLHDQRTGRTPSVLNNNLTKCQG